MHKVSKQVQEIVEKFIKPKEECTAEFLLNYVENGCFDLYSETRFLFTKVKGHPAVPALLDLIYHCKEKDVVKDAIKTLGILGDKRAIVPLIEIIEDNQDNHALAALAQISVKDGSLQVVDFIEKNKNSRVRNIFLINLINRLRRAEIDQSMAKRWEELRKQDPKPFIMDVHDYIETVWEEVQEGEITKKGATAILPFSTQMRGETEFGHTMIFAVEGEIIFEEDKATRIYWNKREQISCEHWSMEDTSETLLDIDDLDEEEESLEKQRAKAMDEGIIGPRLFCEICGKEKALSPCYSCQSSHLNESNGLLYCPGCGCTWAYCRREYDICKVSEKNMLLAKINEILQKERKEANFSSLNIQELLPQIGTLAYTENLNLNLNQLSELPPEIGTLTHLKILSLDDNQLKKFPQEILPLDNLQTLSLGYNDLRELPAEILQLTNLEELDLIYNQLRELPREIAKLTNLKKIKLYGNKINKDTMQQLKKILPNTEIL